MGQLLNSPWVNNIHRRSSDVRQEGEPFSVSSTARVIAGAARDAGLRPKKAPQSVGGAYRQVRPLQSAHISASGSVFPTPKNIFPTRLSTALPDLLLISAAFFGVEAISGHRLPLATLGFYLIAYVLLVTREVSYGSQAAAPKHLLVIVTAITIASIFTYLALAVSSRPSALRPVGLWIGLNLLLITARHHTRKPRGKTAAARNAMIIGDPSFGQAVFESLQHDGNLRDVREFLLDRCLLDPHGASLMGRIARQACIDEVIIATRDAAIMRAAVREAKRNRLDAYVAPDLSGVPVLGCEEVGGLPLLKVAEQRSPEWALTGKRSLDVLLSTIGLVVLLPLFALIAILIGLESPGPVLYRSARIGQKGRRFRCCKFRTMVPEADAIKSQLRALNQRKGAFFKIADDPRMTRVGRILRRYSLDELPQLWNVLCGDMSLVGPRPHPPDDVARYGTGDLRRLDFVPGITGLWQVTARQDPSFQRCVELDVEYIESWSLSLDFKILWRTIGVVLQGTGA